MGLSKALRFDIFKRDRFTCQYCGRRPPDVILEVDHVLATSQGGDSDPSNLISSCFDCNRGKRDKRLDVTLMPQNLDLEYLEAEQRLSELRWVLYRYDPQQVEDAITIASGLKGTPAREKWRYACGVLKYQRQKASRDG